jgi:hypothetical protein
MRFRPLPSSRAKIGRPTLSVPVLAIGRSAAVAIPRYVMIGPGAVPAGVPGGVVVGAPVAIVTGVLDGGGTVAVGSTTAVSVAVGSVPAVSMAVAVDDAVGDAVVRLVGVAVSGGLTVLTTVSTSSLQPARTIVPSAARTR